ncbi:c-type cytochrome [Psychrobacter sp. PP-21]|uniref:c-type cytochrome n=1 Tax=Psychrobacter sp. PP-21 TaxID=2957503 RepID=UPI0029A99A63|nr:c-type cytochrome [Psychrobacter sp. PP-21]MDX2373839.1 c-type cytochrome [Psychrobacter sp. PP-21]
MIEIQQHINKLSLSAISISMLLALSACSSDNEAATAPVESDATEATVAADAPVIDTTSEIDATEQTITAETDVAAEPKVLTANAGSALYESNCKVCHTAGLLNAPKYGDKAAWTARLTKDKEVLYMHSVKGFNKMPAQAVDGVTEEQVKAAVDYMLASVS